jgi:uncharacterized membrane protein
MSPSARQHETEKAVDDHHGAPYMRYWEQSLGASYWEAFLRGLMSLFGHVGSNPPIPASYTGSSDDDWRIVNLEINAAAKKINYVASGYERNPSAEPLIGVPSDGYRQSDAFLQCLEVVAEHERQFPGSGRRILEMAESQLQHRWQSERIMVRESAKRARTSALIQRSGQVLGFLMLLGMVWGGAMLVMLGFDVAGALVSGGTTVGILVAIAVAGVFHPNKAKDQSS